MRAIKTESRLPAAIGRVYKSDPPLNPLLGGDFGRFAPKNICGKINKKEVNPQIFRYICVE